MTMKQNTNLEMNSITLRVPASLDLTSRLDVVNDWGGIDSEVEEIFSLAT